MSKFTEWLKSLFNVQIGDVVHGDLVKGDKIVFEEYNPNASKRPSAVSNHDHPQRH